jgi:hypothetical protein
MHDQPITHQQALALYRQLLAQPDPDPTHHTYAAACLFYMGSYEEAEDAAQRGPRSPLQVRARGGRKSGGLRGSNRGLLLAGWAALAPM